MFTKPFHDDASPINRMPERRQPMWRKVCLITVVVVAVAIPAAAQLVNETQFFPVVAHTAGAGDPPTSWRTDLTVHNVMDGELTVGVMFFESGNISRVMDGDLDDFINAFLKMKAENRKN